MFRTGIEAMGGARASASLGGAQAASPGTAMAPGARMASPGGSGPANPFMPSHPAGIALWVGLGAIGLYFLLWYSLPA